MSLRVRYFTDVPGMLQGCEVIFQVSLQILIHCVGIYSEYVGHSRTRVSLFTLVMEFHKFTFRHIVGDKYKHNLEINVLKHTLNMSYIFGLGRHILD